MLCLVLSRFLGSLPLVAGRDRSSTKWSLSLFLVLIKPFSRLITKMVCYKAPGSSIAHKTKIVAFFLWMMLNLGKSGLLVGTERGLGQRSFPFHTDETTFIFSLSQNIS